MTSLQVVENSASLAQINTNGIRATYPVVGADHGATATAINWLLGRGHVLVADGGKIIAEDGEAPGDGFFYWVRRDSLHSSLYLQITMSAMTTDGSNSSVAGRVEQPYGSGIYQTFAVDTTPITFRLRIDYTAADVAEEFSFRVFNDHQSDGSGAPGVTPVQLLIHQIMVYEAPQPTLDGAGIDLQSFQQRSPIFSDSSGNGKSIEALRTESHIAAHTYFRRGGLFTSAAPIVKIVSNGPSGGTTAYGRVFAVDPAIQAPLLPNGATTKACKVRIHGYVFGTATSGDVRFTMTNGSTATCSYSSATPGWSSTHTLNVETDDPTRWTLDGGIRGGTRDSCLIEARVTSTTSDGGFVVNGVSVWDEPA